MSSRIIWTFSLVALSLLVGNDSLAGVYKWGDADGRLHFTDSPNKIPAQYRKKVQKVFEDDARKDSSSENTSKNTFQGIEAEVSYKSIKVTTASTHFGTKWAKNQDENRRRLTWKATFKNNNDRAVTIIYNINFLDSLGNVIHERRATLKGLKANSRKVQRDFEWAGPTLSKHVVKASVEILRKIKVRDKKSPIETVVRFGAKYGALDFTNLSEKAVIFAGKIFFVNREGFVIGKYSFSRKYLPPGGKERLQLVKLGKGVGLKAWNDIDVVIDTYQLTSKGPPRIR